MTSLYDAIVIGAGPAGSAAAATLAQRGRQVALIEKDMFPRHKVCGAFLSADALPLLDRLGVRPEIDRFATETISRGAVHLPGGLTVSFRLRLPALGISRRVFDDLLARKACGAGAQARFGARVLTADRVDGRFRVAFATPDGLTELEARTVLGAWGRWDALDKTLDRSFLRGGRRFFAWSRDFCNEEGLAGSVRLYLFRGGYCGLSRVEGGAVNLAGVVSEKVRRAAGGWEEVVAFARSENRALDRDLAPLAPGPIGYLGTGPVFFTAKPPVENGILMAGDSAGVIDPFSGQGQAAALASGVLAGETVDAALSGEIPLEALAREYAHAWKRRFAPRFAWSAAFRSLMLHPGAASIAARTGGERLIRFGIERLQNLSGDRVIG